MSDKIINTFQQRRELQNRIASLSNSQTEAEMLKVVRGIAHEFPVDIVHKVMLKALDTSNSQLRGGLAHLATMLPPEETIPLLRSTVADRSHSTQLRLNAVTVLERFLGEEVSPALLGDLENTDEIAFQSLCEAIEEGHRERHIFLEYVIQMREEDEEVAYIVMDQLSRLPARDQLDLLRLMAQDEREPVAFAALKRLEELDPKEAGDRLAAVIYSLQFTLPPELAGHAERAARKLRFNGYKYNAPDSQKWRALISPAEATGNQTIWFFQSDELAQEANTDQQSSPNGSNSGDSNSDDSGSDSDSDNRETPFLSIVVNLDTGILQTYGTDRMVLEDLPHMHEIGELMTVSLDGGDSIVFLEAPFDYARWLVFTALAPHWSGDAWQPLFGEYSLYNDMLWQFPAPELSHTLKGYFANASAQSGHEQSSQGEPTEEQTTKSADGNSLTDPEDEIQKLDEMAAELLQHPAMGGWILHSYLFWNAIQAGFKAGDDNSIDDLTQTVIQEVMKWPEQDIFIQGLHNGLKCQSAWLKIAGMDKAAEQAHQLAQSLATQTANHNPFLYRYLRQAIAAR